MQPPSDAQLLRDYAENGREAAFTELVQRHTNLVYSAALRQVESAAVAADIAQAVFLGLVRSAPGLLPRLVPEASLAGWLCRSARNLSCNHRRDEFRRQLRESQGMEQLIATTAETPDWDRLRHVLDQAMASLDETDYDVLVQRFYQNQPFRAVGAALGVSDDTAQKRVTRALDKLRDHLAQHGIHSTAAGLGVAISTNAVQAAPAGLAVAIAAAALSGAALATTATVTTATLVMTTLQKATVTAALVMLAGAGVFEARQAAAARTEAEALRRQADPLSAQIAQLQAEHSDATNRLADLAAENQRLKQQVAELNQLRGQVAQLQTEKSQAKAKAKASTLANQDIIAYANDQERRSATNAVSGQARAFAAKLGLTPEQQQAMRDIMTANIAARVDLDIREQGGDISHEAALAQLKRIKDQENQDLSAVLTPDQLAAYQQLLTDQDTASRQSFARHEAGSMQKLLSLTADQQTQITDILSSLPPGQGGPGYTDYTNAPEQLEQRLTAFAAVLSPDQLSAYRQKKLADIQDTLAQKQMAQQAFKALAK